MSLVRTVARRRWIFLSFLTALHLVFVLGPENSIARWLFLSHIGLGLIWQPFIQPRRRLGLEGAVVVVCAAALLATFLGWGILLVWTVLLAGVVGGKVFVFPDRWERIFHLAGLGYLVMVVLVRLLPAAVNAHVSLEILPGELANLLAPLILVFMALLPVRQGTLEERAEIVDFIYGMFVVLLLTVLVLGSLSFSLLYKVGYLESILITLGVVAGLLLMLALIWNPRAGFAGLGTAVAQHVISLGLPIEEWLQSLADLGRFEADPERFLSLACAELPRRLPGVLGGIWSVGGAQGEFGERHGHRTRFVHGGLTVELVTRSEPSPMLRWHHDLVVRLLAEFYLGKWRARELQRLSYIEAIHETGARLTHDVKNLLQSLDTLCVAANEAGATASPRFGELLRRQLPAISARLRQTLNKLVEPGKQLQPAEQPQTAAEWLASLQNRYVDDETQIQGEGDLPACRLPAPALFFSVAENLLQNIAAKRRRQPGIKASVRLVCLADQAYLEICDTGAAIPPELAGRLLHERVTSEDGLGIGLYQCARQAEQADYRLSLVENRTGRVCFRLEPSSDG
ncbi:ATP-binding protein [Sulfuricystis multivorans]|uniref:ATP-binding protein n=1 Tax=Sulfuricystis multivorans TaxID=2211108 RepID=UPI000F83C524|nr:ATP-binding protein [Sulfuricystis multivorans]